MSLQAFQQAFSDLVASPELSRAMRVNPEPVLDLYTLSTRERRRLTEVARQPGMSANCTLYRANRFTAICTLLPLTCFLLEDALAAEVHLFWKDFRDKELQFKQTIDQFGAFLQRRIKAGSIENAFLEEILDFELAVTALRFLPRHEILKRISRIDLRKSRLPVRLHPLIKIVQFRHDPSGLLALLNDQTPLPYFLPEGDFYLVLDARSEEMQIRIISSNLGAMLAAFNEDCVQLVRAEVEESLVAEGFLCTPLE
jgi:hypothetical protein